MNQHDHDPSCGILEKQTAEPMSRKSHDGRCYPWGHGLEGLGCGEPPLRWQRLWSPEDPQVGMSRPDQRHSHLRILLLFQCLTHLPRIGVCRSTARPWDLMYKSKSFQVHASKKGCRPHYRKREAPDPGFLEWASFKAPSTSSSTCGCPSTAGVSLWTQVQVTYNLDCLHGLGPTFLHSGVPGCCEDSIAVFGTCIGWNHRRNEYSNWHHTCRLGRARQATSTMKSRDSEKSTNKDDIPLRQDPQKAGLPPCRVPLFWGALPADFRGKQKNNNNNNNNNHNRSQTGGRWNVAPCPAHHLDATRVRS